jgi:hypothetical protein
MIWLGLFEETYFFQFPFLTVVEGNPGALYLEGNIFSGNSSLLLLLQTGRSKEF